MRAALASIAGALGVIAAGAVIGNVWSAGSPPDARPGGLMPASSFAAIADDEKRAVALFNEAGKVLLHPRCVNCHPKGERPLQGSQQTPHQPLVVRGDDNLGAIGMRCNACHGPANFEAAGVPGHPLWHLAPKEMAWEGKTLGEICQQIKDPARNGGKNLDELVKHMAEDSLVGWGWRPGGDRTPAPGSQAAFGELFKAWADAGAACPHVATR